jgi:predicted PurR-regulated permease PerM
MRSELPRWTVRGAGLTVGILLVYGLVQLGIAAGGILLLLFIAVLLASALEPMIGWIREHLPLGRGATILVVYAGFFVGVLTVSLIVVPGALRQAGDLLADLPPFFAEARAWAETLRPSALSGSVTALIDAVAQILRPPEPLEPDEVVEVGGVVAEAATGIAAVLTIVFFWLIEHARLQRYALAFLPAHRRAGAREAWNEIESRLGMWVRGQLVLMGSIGVAAGLLCAVLGVPGALLLGLIAALTEAIPIVGPVLGAVPAILIAATVSPELALVIGLGYLALQIVEGSVLVPLVMRNTVGISPLLVLVSLLIGGQLGGLVGAFLAVPVAASLEIILSRFQARESRVAQDPAAIEDPDDGATRELARSLPDAGNANLPAD